MSNVTFLAVHKKATSAQMSSLTTLLQSMVGEAAKSVAVQEVLSQLDADGAERLKGELGLTTALNECVAKKISEMSIPTDASIKALFGQQPAFAVSS